MTKLQKYLKIGSIEAIAYLISQGISFRRIVIYSSSYLTDQLLSSLMHFGFNVSNIDDLSIHKLPYMDEDYLPWLYNNVPEHIKSTIISGCERNFCYNALKNIGMHHGAIDLRVMTVSEMMEYYINESWVPHIIRCNRIDLLAEIIKNYNVKLWRCYYTNITYDAFMYLFKNNVGVQTMIYCSICNIGDEILDVLLTDTWFCNEMGLLSWVLFYAAIKNNQQRCIEYFLKNLPDLDRERVNHLNAGILSKELIDKIFYQKTPHYINRRNGNPIPSKKCAIRLLTQMVLYSDGYFVCVNHKHKHAVRFYNIIAQLPFDIQTIIACVYGNTDLCAIVINNSNIWRELV